MKNLPRSRQPNKILQESIDDAIRKSKQKPEHQKQCLSVTVLVSMITIKTGQNGISERSEVKTSYGVVLDCFRKM